MKVFHFNGYFLLPDDFCESEADAIKLLAEYHNKAQTEGKEKVVSDKRHIDSSEVWQEFLDAIDEGYRLHAEIFCGEVK